MKTKKAEIVNTKMIDGNNSQGDNNNNDDNDDDDNRSSHNHDTSSSSFLHTEHHQAQQHRIAMICDFFYPRLGGVENHIYNLSYQLIQFGHKVIVITNGGYYENDDIQTTTTTKTSTTNDDPKEQQQQPPPTQKQRTQQQQRNQSRSATIRPTRKRRIGVRYLPGPLKVYYCPMIPMVDNDIVPTFTATLPLIRSIIIREQINIIHCHQATSTLANEGIVYAAMMNDRKYHNVRSVYTDHSLFSIDDNIASVILNRVQQVSLCTANAIICVSYACRDNFILRTKYKQNGEDDDRQICVIPNAVSAQKFKPPTMTELRQRDMDDKIKIVVISRLVYRKGVDLLIHIIPIVCQIYPNQVSFIIGGDGTKLLAMQEMVEREQIHDSVLLLGSVPHSNVRNVLCLGHIFLNCSLTESFCIAILEAACTGMKVVSTNVGGIPEVLPNEMIYLANPNVKELTKQLCRAIDNCMEEKQQQRHRQQSDKNKGNDHGHISYDVAIERINKQHVQIQQMYSWDRVARETIQVYNQIRTSKNKTLDDRLNRYYHSVGGYVGIAAFFVTYILVMTIEVWFRIVEWWLPIEQIEIVPDLVDHHRNTKEHQHTKNRPISVRK